MSTNFRNTIHTVRIWNDVVYTVIRLTAVITLIETTTRTITSSRTRISTTTAFQPIHSFHCCQNRFNVKSSSVFRSTTTRTTVSNRNRKQLRQQQQFPSVLKLTKYEIEDSDDDDDDEESDSYIDPNTLADWRSFRKSLMAQQQEEQQNKQLNIIDITEIESSSAVEQEQQQSTQSKQQQQQIKNELSSSSFINIEDSITDGIIEATTPKSQTTTTTTSATTTTTKKDNNLNKNTKYCIENYNKLKEQNSKLADEYKTNVWAHRTATPEIGGIVVRNPLEFELYINHKHSLNGAMLRRQLNSYKNNDDNNNYGKGNNKYERSSYFSSSRNDIDDDTKQDSLSGADAVEPAVWYRKAQLLIEQQMKHIADLANDNGQIETATLKHSQAEMLQLYIDNQENWQEVCLVLNTIDSRTETLVLNRPMAFKLTNNLAQLILFGSFSTTTTSSSSPTISKKESITTSYYKNKDGVMTEEDEEDVQLQKNTVLTEHERKQKLLVDFVAAFRDTCGIYIGGTDNQHREGIMIHGIPGLRNSREISPGTGIYEGGLEDAIHGVLDGKYNPNEFRFFVGKNVYNNKKLDVDIILGKYQPMACHKSIVLKQCIGLPKPLWNEVSMICGGVQNDIAELETIKFSLDDNVQFQVIDDDDDDDDDDNVDGIIILKDYDDDSDDNEQDIEYFGQDMEYFGIREVNLYDSDDDDDDDDDDDEDDESLLYFNR